MNIKAKKTNRRKNEPLVKFIRTERRVRENGRFYYCNCLL